ncbi:MAG: MarR family transcriptional regulator [Candidatus Woesearchaeota archaeon]
MIKFACKNFKIDDVIKCSLSLNKTDYKIFKYFFDQNDDWVNAEDLSSHLNLHISACQRSLKKLTDKDVLFRKQLNLKNGGYVFIYKIKSLDYLRNLIFDIVSKWTKMVESELLKW